MVVSGVVLLAVAFWPHAVTTVYARRTPALRLDRRTLDNQVVVQPTKLASALGA